jgi:hypothetical protein
VFAVLILAICVAALTFAVHSLTRDNNLGTDFYIYYLAGRALFFDHQDPYSDQIAQQVQMAVLKRLALPNEDQVGFAYPPYGLIPAIPTLSMSFDWAQAFWITVTLLILISSIFVAFPKAPKWTPLSLIFIYPFSFALILGNLNVLVTAILIASYGILVRVPRPSRALQITLGVLLAWSTIKPQFSWLFILFLLLFCLRNRHWALIIAFVLGAVLMMAFSFAVFPSWPYAWYERLVKYTSYNQTWLILTFFLKQIIPLQTAILCTWIAGLGCMAITLKMVYMWWRGKISDLVMMAWCGFLIFLFHPRGKVYEQIPFLIPILLWICQEPRLPRLPVWVFWGGSLVLSWLVFYVLRLPGMPEVIAEIPFLWFIAWAAWLVCRIRPLTPDTIHSDSIRV